MAFQLQDGSPFLLEDGSPWELQNEGPYRPPQSFLTSFGAEESPYVISTHFDVELDIGGAALVDVPVGSVTTTGQVPSVLIEPTGTFATPELGSLEFTGQVPTVLTPHVADPATGTMTFTGLAPSVPVKIAIPVGTLSFTGYAPEAVVDEFFKPPAGSLTINGLAPTVRLNVWSRPPDGSLTITGLAPKAVVGKRAQTQTGALTFTGLVPEVKLHKFSYPPTGNLTLTGQPPSFVHGITAAPPSGTVTFTGFTPEVKIDLPIPVPAGTLTLTGQVPTFIASDNAVFAPGTGSLSFLGQAPLVNTEPPVILANPQNVTVTEGDNTSFTVLATGPNPLTYQWYETTAGLLVGETGPALSFLHVVMAQNGNGYYCEVSDTFNNTLTSTTATMTVLLDTAVTTAGGNFPLVMMLSGGQGNKLTADSIGGAASKGHEGLITSQAMHVDGIDELPMVYVIGGTGLELGLGTLSWDPTQGTLSFTDFAANETSVQVGPTGYYWSGANPGQVLLWVQGTLPGSPASVDYVVNDWQQNLFDDVALSERGSNHTNYRCFYLRNNTPQAMAEVSIRVDVDPQYGLTHVATEYPSDAGVNAADATYVEANAIQRGGTLIMGARTEEAVADYVDFTFKGGPFLRPAYERILSNNVSDGSTVQVAAQLADENDSTNVLAGLSWGDTITWKNIPSGSYVSVWVRREIGAGVSGSAEEQDKFTMDIRYKRTS